MHEKACTMRIKNDCFKSFITNQLLTWSHHFFFHFFFYIPSSSFFFFFLEKTCGQTYASWITILNDFLSTIWTMMTWDKWSWTVAREMIRNHMHMTWFIGRYLPYILWRIVFDMNTLYYQLCYIQTRYITIYAKI